MSPEIPKLRLPTELKIRPITALNLSLLTLAVVAFVLLATRSSPDPGIEVERRSPPAGVDEIRVDIRGAVREPGVYSATPGDRISDLLMLAGGATVEADLDAVNLALRVRDEDHIRIPTVGDSVTPLIDVNTATQSELEGLPGIGPVRAAEIIRSRPYATTDDLQALNVIPANIYEQIRTLVTAR